MKTALMAAVEGGLIESVKYVLKLIMKERVNAVDVHLMTALMMACQVEGEAAVAIVTVLFQHGADLTLVSLADLLHLDYDLNIDSL